MNKRKWMLLAALINFTIYATAQTDSSGYFITKKMVAATPVKNQAATGTCWCFSTTSLVESQCIKNGGGVLDLSEMFTVRNIYIEKAKNYILRQGHAQFGEGGLGHDEIRALATYGAIPESVYSGLLPGQKAHNHLKLFDALQRYVDSVLKLQPLPSDWLQGYTKILDDQLGIPPSEFDYNGKHYTPTTFAKQVLKFDANDYVFITSFTHHPFYESFILEVPDNFSNASYYNVPLADLIGLVKDEINKGYSVMWDADVSNQGFVQGKGFAVNLDNAVKYKPTELKPGMPDAPYSQSLRQQLYENLTTQDDHLMHIVGLSQSKDGKPYFIVKNSWGDVGPLHGYINVSEPYFAINTISLVVPRAGLSKNILDRMIQANKK